MLFSLAFTDSLLNIKDLIIDNFTVKMISESNIIYNIEDLYTPIN